MKTKADRRAHPGVDLARLRFVLVEPTHPGNIGGAARAMKTMGLTSLYLVGPGEFPSQEATRRAVGAEDLLEQAIVTERLQDAVADCGLVMGTTARPRSIELPVSAPDAAAADLVAASSNGPVALLFGRESSGLTNFELELCQRVVHIPTNESFSSLNLASAVQILAYEVRLAVRAPALARRIKHGEQPATATQMSGFYTHLEETLYWLDFVKTDPSTKLMRKLKRLFNRSGLTEEEINLLRGILTAARDAAGRRS